MVNRAIYLNNLLLRKSNRDSPMISWNVYNRRYFCTPKTLLFCTRYCLILFFCCGEACDLWTVYTIEASGIFVLKREGNSLCGLNRRIIAVWLFHCARHQVETKGQEGCKCMPRYKFHVNNQELDKRGIAFEKCQQSAEKRQPTNAIYTIDFLNLSKFKV